MRRKKAIKKHSVKASMQIMVLTKAGSSMELEIYANRERIGRIEIGRGSFTWYGRHKAIGKTIPWSKFSELMNDYCYPE